jgi:solute carrier family 25 S-adenosylmethionine transporter 26
MKYYPQLPQIGLSIIPIGFGVICYWLFRTPAEVIKTKVQTKQTENVLLAIQEAKAARPNGISSLWKYYPVMLWLDIPFQIINFVLYGIVSESVKNAGFESNIITRLFCGISCGMTAAGLTCPLDVCKTRIISRDKAEMTSSATAILLDENDKDSFLNTNNQSIKPKNANVLIELVNIFKEEGIGTLFLGIKQRLLYTGLANGIRLSAYGTSRLDLMMRSLDEL